MIAPIQLFSPDPGKITDFSAIPTADIFNKSVLPRMAGIEQLLQPSGSVAPTAPSGLAEASRNDLFNAPSPTFTPPPSAQRDLSQYAVTEEDYNAPVPPPETPEQRVDPADFDSLGYQKESLKLSNYGYSSDSSPDYNSNVKKIGHANNPLEDGVSAALTKSLASRYGLKTGDFFEAVTADGQVLKRRYDDTVPTTYKGKPLPETVDLYDQAGSNSFGGKVIGLRPLITP